MLLLTRNQDESILIGDDIEIVVVRTGTRVKLGITCPRNIPVHRREIYDRIKQGYVKRGDNGDSA